MSAQSPQEYYAHLAYGLHPEFEDARCHVVGQGDLNGPPSSVTQTVAIGGRHVPHTDVGVDVYTASVAHVAVDLRVAAHSKALVISIPAEIPERPETQGGVTFRMAMGEELIIEYELPARLSGATSGVLDTRRDVARAFASAALAATEGTQQAPEAVYACDEEVVIDDQIEWPEGGFDLDLLVVHREATGARFRIWGLPSGSQRWRVLNGGAEIHTTSNWMERVVVAGISRLYVEVLQVDGDVDGTAPRVTWTVAPCAGDR